MIFITVGTEPTYISVSGLDLYTNPYSENSLNLDPNLDTVHK